MKRILLIIVALGLLLPMSAQTQFIRFQGGMAFVAPNKASGYTISGTYQGKFLGIFRPGFGMQAMNMVSDSTNLLSHQSALDANLSWGVALKLGVRLQAGLGMFGRLWQKSFAADNTGPQLYSVDGINYTLNSGQYVSFNYLTWGMLYYVNAGIDVARNVEIFAYYQGKSDIKKDVTSAFGIGLSFRM